jgi:hypothetical protein
VGGHGYIGGAPSVHSDPISKGKHCWMTEHYLTGGQNDIGESMALAQEMNDYMNAQFSAYIWWWVNDSDTNCDLVYNDGTTYKIGYVMGQFAKWVRPNSTRVAATYNPQSNVSVTAYKVNNGTVVVAVNTGGSSVSQQFVIQNGNAATMEGYRTSSSQNMADIGNFNVSGGSFTANLPAQSVTTFVQTSSVTTSGTYKLLSRYSGKALDANNNGTANGTQIIQWTYGAGANQQWRISSVGNNLYSIIGVGSGKCIDISGWGTTNDTKVQLWDYVGGSNQKFYFNPTTNGYYEISPSYATGSCLDVQGPSTADGAVVHLWQWVNANNQQWLVQPVDGTVKLISQNSGKCLCPYGGGTANGTQIHQWDYINSSYTDQQWTLTDTGSGNYKFINVKSGRALDISGGGTANQTKVQLWDFYANTAQLYKLTSTEVGQFRISPNCAPGSCLDVSGVSTANGAVVQLWQSNGQANQKWSVQAP